MGVTFEISTRRPKHYAGGTVDGTVAMEVASKNPEGSRANELKLRLVGRVRTIVPYTTSNGTSTVSHRATESKEIISEEVVLGSFDGRIATGRHTFPFSFSLPSDLLPSTEESDYGSCSVRYSLKARLDHGGIFGDPRSKLRLSILGAPWETVSATPTVVGPASKVVRKWLMASGTMTIGCRVDRLQVRTGEAIQLTIILQNDSPVTVNAMHIKMKQLAKWKASIHKSSKTRTLVSVEVPGSELGGAERRAAGSERGQSAESIAEAAREDVQQRLEAGDGTQYRLEIPHSALLSMEIENIKVSHWLSVKLKTKGFNSSPELSSPVHVRPPEVTVFEATAGPVEQQPTEEDAATGVEVGASGDGKSESAPLLSMAARG